MTSPVANQMKSCVRLPAMPIEPGETVAAQMRRSWERLGRPAWWRLKAAWYGEAGSFSAQAASDLQDRFVRWREAEARRAASAAATQTLLRARQDRAELEAARDAHRSQLAQIERQLAACEAALRVPPSDAPRP